MSVNSQFTFSLVEDLQFHPASGTIVRQMFEIPDKYEPPKVTERLKKAYNRPDLIGRATKMTKIQYLGVLFLRNEINACIAKPVTQDIIFRQLCREFPQWDRKAADNFFRDISKHRHNYNGGILHAQQPKPLLFSFYYNDNGYICHKINRKQMMTFPFCKGETRAHLFADPRFYTLKELAEFRTQAKNNPSSTYARWNIPSVEDIEAIEDIIKKPVYNSITFADGYGINSKII